MDLINQLLNLAALLLWLSWRTKGWVTKSLRSRESLLITLRRADPAGPKRWLLLVALVTLLGARAWFFWELGTALGWTPRISLGAIVIYFRADLFGRMLLFSLLSFLWVLAGFYFWLLLLSALNARVRDPHEYLSLVRFHLGRLEALPRFLKFISPGLVAGLLWLALGPLLGKLRLHVPGASMVQTAEEALLIGLAAFLMWKYLLVGLLLLFLFTSYVYVGPSALWKFVTVTAHKILAPLNWLPLRIGRADFRPVVAIVIVLLASEALARWLPRQYRALPF